MHGLRRGGVRGVVADVVDDDHRQEGAEAAHVGAPPQRRLVEGHHRRHDDRQHGRLDDEHLHGRLLNAAAEAIDERQRDDRCERGDDQRGNKLLHVHGGSLLEPELG